MASCCAFVFPDIWFWSGVSAGMNLLLVWGGGIWQYEPFYDAADELGVMLYHDLMYSAQKQSAHLCTATETQRREIVYNVRRLAQRPCIAAWAGGNEIGGRAALPCHAGSRPLSQSWPDDRGRRGALLLGPLR